MITEAQRIADLEQKVESLDLCVTDLRRSVEVLNRLIDQMRLAQLQMLARAAGVAVEHKN